MGRSYGRGVPLKTLAESMAKVSFPRLAVKIQDREKIFLLVELRSRRTLRAT